MRSNLARSELLEFDLEALKANGQRDASLTSQIKRGLVPLDTARGIVMLRPAVSVWYKTMSDMERYISILQMRILKGNRLMFRSWVAQPFWYECNAVSTQVMDFVPYTLGERSVGSWSADVAVKFLSPEAKSQIQNGMFQQAMSSFQYVLIAQLQFEVRDTRVRISAAGEFQSQVDVRALQRIPVDVGDI